LATKNIPDVQPTVLDLVAPALPRDNTHTTLVLLQNGLNIEKPFVSYSPQTPVLSAVSLIGSEERSVGHIIHDEADRVFIGAFQNANINAETGVNKAREFVHIYSKGGKTDCIYSANVRHDRWKKLVYNACLNPICAITGLDTGRIRLADGGLDGLVKPAMREIVQAAKAVGVDLPENVVDFTINVDPLESYLKPSMQQDLGKVCLILFHCFLFVLAF
jgi:2-dehydropantoate 2-reductase